MARQQDGGEREGILSAASRGAGVPPPAQQWGGDEQCEAAPRLAAVAIRAASGVVVPFRTLLLRAASGDSACARRARGGSRDFSFSFPWFLFSRGARSAARARARA